MDSEELRKKQHERPRSFPSWKERLESDPMWKERLEADPGLMDRLEADRGDEELQSRKTKAKRSNRAYLISVARYQKRIIACVLMNVVAATCLFVAPDLELLFIALAFVVSLVSTAFLFLLAITMYGTETGVVLGVLSLVPCVGLVVLLVVIIKATRVLKQNGIKVGLLGADLSQV